MPLDVEPETPEVDLPQRRRNRVLTTFGVTLILAGVALLAYFVWEYFGTNIVSKHRQETIRHSLVLQWGKGLDGDAIGLLHVDRFGTDYSVPIVKGFDKNALASGIGWDTKSAKPGDVGNFAIAGHRVTHGEPFAKFPSLRKGDLVEVETRTNVFTYRLRQGGKDITVDFTVGWPLWPVPAPDARKQQPTKAVITMLTCSELFHTTNRSVVIGDLISTVTKSSESGATSG